MDFRIADSFTDSLGKLTSVEQGAAKTTAFDLQMNPAHPSLQFHRLDKTKDKNFWSVRVNADIRIIVHRTDASLMLCYVHHHNNAYRWAERRKLERHPTTGAMQLVEIRERVVEIPKYVEVEQPAPPKPLLFDGIADEELLSYGVPEEWLADVKAANEDSLLDLAPHLPQEAAEALLNIAVGASPITMAPVAVDADPFEHPDAKRRFRVMTNVEELEQALAYPWDKWTVFLHPAQLETVERSYNGPARVSGSAGTGKTIVALHRAVDLVRKHADSRVLLTTFSNPLADALRDRLDRLVGNEKSARERIAVASIDAVGVQLFTEHFGKPKLATEDDLRAAIREAAACVEGHKFTEYFLIGECREIVDEWQIDSWEAYRVVPRLGRKTRIGEKQRQTLWAIFERVRVSLDEAGFMTMPTVFRRLTEAIGEGAKIPFDHAVIDESQDISVPQLRFLAALAGERPDGLFFAGDLGQRIFQTPFSWKSLGVDVRGRSQTLRINYRTSHQIRRQADRLLGPETTDVDGLTEDRRGTISVFNGPEPTVVIADSADGERDMIAKWLAARVDQGVEPAEIGVFVRSAAELDRARAAVEAAGLEHCEMSRIGEKGTAVNIGTMHLAKGLEFRAVVVAACDDEVIPLQSRIEEVGDASDLEEVYNTERHLLYVACTRARDYLLVTGVDPASEFLDDLIGT